MHNLAESSITVCEDATRQSITTNSMGTFYTITLKVRRASPSFQNHNISLTSVSGSILVFSNQYHIIL